MLEIESDDQDYSCEAQHRVKPKFMHYLEYPPRGLEHEQSLKDYFKDQKKGKNKMLTLCISHKRMNNPQQEVPHTILEQQLGVPSHAIPIIIGKASIESPVHHEPDEVSPKRQDKYNKPKKYSSDYDNFMSKGKEKDIFYFCEEIEGELLNIAIEVEEEDKTPQTKHPKYP